MIAGLGYVVFAENNFGKDDVPKARVIVGVEGVHVRDHPVGADLQTVASRLAARGAGD